MNIYVPGTGNRNAKIVFIGEAPSYQEEIELKPFVGPSGKFLDGLLREVGINRDDCWVTNVSKYAVPPSPKDKKIPFSVRAHQVGIDLNLCIEELRTELNEINPNIIVPLGASALWATTGKTNIQSHRGSILQGMGFKCIPTYHPAHILHGEGDVKGYYNVQVITHDLKRIKKHSFDKQIRLPYRHLHVAKGSFELLDFIKRNEDKSHPAIDIEAFKCIPICVGISFDRAEGITVPLWNTYDISTISDNELVSMWMLLSDFLSQHDVVGQNFGYDRDKLLRLGFAPRSLKSDLLFKSFAINPELPKNLAFNTSIYTEEPYYKDEGMYEGSVNDLLIGCARDACVTKEIDEEMDPFIDKLGNRKYYEQFLLPLYDLYSTVIEQQGFLVDEDERTKLVQKYVKWHEDISFKLFQITNKYVNTSSPKQVADLMYGDWGIPIRKGTGEEVITQLLNGAVKNELHRQGLELILEDRRVKKTISQYLTVLPDFDGRIRTSYFLCLDTGRSATSMQDPPIRPDITYRDNANKLKHKSLGSPFQVFTKHGEIGPEARRIYIVDKGCVFLQADSSQAEARVIFKLANDDEALHLIDNCDYHALTASWFFGGYEKDYSKKELGYESPIRFAGKTLRHACHLGAGKRRAATEINTQCRKFKIDYRITEAKCDQAIKIFHARQPKIQEVFHKGVRDCLEFGNRRLVAPVPYGIDSEVGGVRTFFERWNDELFRQAYSYLPQRTVSENTKAAALRIHKRAPWIKIIVEAHDALLVQVLEEQKYEAAAIMKEEFERAIDFSTCSLKRDKLIIPCEIEMGYNYKDLSKFKFHEVMI